MARLRGLLWCGVAGPVWFLAVIVVNDRVKPDYDPVRDFVSEAAIGRGGWVQIVSFLTTGTLLLLFSRALCRWTRLLVGITGACLIAAGVFVTDPVPSSGVTWHGVAHNVVSVVVFLSLSLACFTAARWRPTPSWRAYCMATGVALPVLFVTAGAVTGTGGVWQRLTIVVGWSWLAVLALRALRLRDAAEPPAGTVAPAG